MKASISVCMIVKNEADNIRQCLLSILPHVEELHLVDTGSVDGTPEIARACGAEVHFFWRDRFPNAFMLDDEANGKSVGAPPPYSNEWHLVDFGGARQFSWGKARCEYAMWIDGDDVVTNAAGLSDVLADMQKRGLNCGFFAYNYATDGQGRKHWRQWRERLVKRADFHWVNPIHEVLIPSGPMLFERYNQVTIEHRRRPDRSTMPNRNYKVLLRQLAQDKDAGRVPDPRTMFYLGNEARFIEPARAVEFYQDYLDRSGWPEERAAAHLSLGALFEGASLGPRDLRRAEREYGLAATCGPNSPDGLFALARMAYYRDRWAECVGLTEQGLAKQNPESMLGANPTERAYRPFLFAHYALNRLGRVEEALACCIKGLEACPEDPGSIQDGAHQGQLAHSKEAYERHLAEQRAKAPGQEAMLGADVNAPASPLPTPALAAMALELWKHARKDDPAAAQNLFASLPESVRNEPAIQQAMKLRSAPHDASSAGGVVTLKCKSLDDFLADNKTSYDGPKVGKYDPSLDIVIWTGPGIEWWCPTTPNERGLGGSETACIEVAKNLVALGHRVTVYADCPHMDGVYDGVTYKHFGAFNGADCDVFISSRQPGAIQHPINARAKFLWLHDIHCGPPDAAMERDLLAYDRVLCLSEWHKRFVCETYPTLHPDRVLVTRNGIDPARFKATVVEGYGGHVLPLPPKENVCVFSSSPNRGLDALLDLWPDIRKRVPDAQLHVCYGFDTWEKFAARAGNRQELAEIAGLKQRLMEQVSRGVVIRGRVKQDELADLFMRAKAWTYPTNFTETYCVSAAEAMAAGCVPVTTRLAALAETVKVGFLLDGPNSSQAYREKFVDAAVFLMTNEAERGKVADKARAYALQHLTWAGLAREWEAMFARVADEVNANPVPVWRTA